MIQAKLPPGPEVNLLWNKEANIKTDILGYFHKSVRQYNGISRARLGPYYYVNVSEPAYIEHIFLNRDVYIKGRDNKNLKFLLGNGLLTNEGEFWLKQRRLMQPLFHKQRLQGFVQKIKESTDAMLSSWEARKNQVADLHSEMTKVTLEIVSQTLLSTEVRGDFKKISDALVVVMEGMMGRSGTLLRLPYWMPTPRNIHMRKNRALLNETIRKIIDERRKDKRKYDDLLAMLIEVEDADTRERMTDEQLRDEVITIFLAGHETTANALAFTFYLLAKHPEVKQRVEEEFKKVINGNEITYDALNRLEYTTMVIKESMRLYPPAWGVLREAAKDDVIDGHLIKKGDSIVMSPYAVQRMEKYWENPLKFDPDRFSTERMKNIHRYAWFPFGGGQRFCIGNNFAMMEMQIVLALACTQFNFTLADNFKLELEPLVTLRPKHGVMVKLQKM
ncbi:MAG: cytochrome P450 [Bacteroidota bacterium]